MKLLAITHTPDLPERHLLGGLAARGHELHLMLSAEGAIRESLTAAGVHCYPLTIRSRFDIGAILQIRRAMQRIAPDVVHCFTARGLTASLVGSVGLSMRIVAYRGTSGHLSRFDPMSWLGFLSPRVRAIVAVSEAVKRYLVSQGVPEKRVSVIYKGHDPAWYTPAPRSIWSELGIDSDRLIAICVANARPVKGLDLLIAAATRLPTHSKIMLVIVGDLRDSRIIPQAEALRGRVRLLGFRSDATALIGAADLLVVPSRDREGLPKSMMEALAQRIPVIVTDVGGMPEIVRNRREGIVVPAEEVQALADAIVEFERAPELRKQFAEAGHERVRNEFNVKRLIDETEALYRSIAEL